MRLAILVWVGLTATAWVSWKWLRPVVPPRAVVQATPPPVTKKMEFAAPAMLRVQPVVEPCSQSAKDCRPTSSSLP